MSFTHTVSCEKNIASHSALLIKVTNNKLTIMTLFSGAEYTVRSAVLFISFPSSLPYHNQPLSLFFLKKKAGGCFQIFFKTESKQLPDGYRSVSVAAQSIKKKIITVTASLTYQSGILYQRETSAKQSHQN